MAKISLILGRSQLRWYNNLIHEFLTWQFDITETPILVGFYTIFSQFLLSFAQIIFAFYIFCQIHQHKLFVVLSLMNDNLIYFQYCINNVCGFFSLLCMKSCWFPIYFKQSFQISNFRLFKCSFLYAILFPSLFKNNF